MARLLSSGFELNSVAANVEIDAVIASTVTVVTSPVRSGTYSLRCKPTSGATATARMNYLASDVQDVYYIRAYVYIAAAGTQQLVLIRVVDSSNANKIAVMLNSNGTLQLRNIEDSINIGSATSALTLNTWYRVEFKVDTTTLASTAIEARLDGVSFASGTANLTSSISRISMGANLADTTYDVYFDDVAVNNSSGSFQNSWPGSGKIIHLRPNAAGDTNGFLAQVGGTVGSANNYTRINEVTPDDVTSYNGSAVLNAEDLFNCDDSGISGSDVVNVVAVGIRMADIAGADATAAFKVEIEKTASGTKSQSANLVPNSTSWKTNAAATPWTHPLVTYQDPDSAAWTQTTLDSMQIGYVQSATNVQTIAASTAWALVDYTVAAEVTTTSTSSSISTSSTSSSISTSTSISTSISTSSTSSSISTSMSTSSTSTSRSTSTSSTSSSISISTSSTSTSISTSSTSSSTSISTSSTSASTSISISTSSTSSSISTSISTSSTSSSISTSTSVSTSTSYTTSTSTSTSSTSSSSSTSTTYIDAQIAPRIKIDLRLS